LIPGLQIWLDAADPAGTGVTPAAGSVLSTWVDKSGNGYNGVGSGSPTITSNKVSFNGTNQYYTIAYPGVHNSETAYIVLTLNNSNNVTVLVGDTSSNVRQIGTYNSKLSFNSLNVGGIPAPTVNFPTNTQFLIDYTMAFSGNTTIYQNGLQVSTGSSVAISSEPRITLGGQLANGGNTAVYMNGTISEFILFNQPLSTAQRQLVEGYLAWKWALTGNLSTSNPYSTGFPLPTTVAGLQCWFDGADPAGTGVKPASGATVTTWVDKSGNGYNGTAAGTPTYNTTYGIAFSGYNGSKYDLPSGAIPFGESSYSIYIVGQFATSSYYPSALLYQGPDTRANSIFIRAYSSGNTIETNWNYNSGLRLLTTTPYTQNRSFLYGSQYQSGGTRNVYLNGTSNGSDTPGVRGQSNSAAVIGGGFNLFYMIGYISEILIFNVSHTPAQRQFIEGYLAWKWSLQNYLPASHSYYSAAPSNSPAPSLPLAYGSVPASIPGLQVWLDGADPAGTGFAPSSGATVATWVDKSGNGNSGSGGVSPTYNTTYGLAFNGTTQYLTLPNGAIPFGDSSYSIFIVLQYLTVSSTLSYFLAAGNGTTNQSLGLRNSQSTSPSAIHLDWYSNDLDTGNTFTTNNSFLVSTSYATRGSRFVYLNGTLGATDTPTAVRSQPNTGNYIAAGYGGTGSFFPGYISEILVYNTAVTTTNRQIIEGYLASKWGLQASLPAAQPYKSLTPPVPNKALVVPALVAGLQVWLDGKDPAGTGVVPGNGSALTTWVDKSGYGNNASGGVSPTYNTTYGLAFNGSTQYLTLPDGAIPYGNASYSIFFVAQTGNQVGYFLAAGDSGNSTSLQIYAASTSIYVDWGAKVLAGALSYTVSTSFVYCTTYESSGSRNQYRNGTAGTSDTPGVRAAPNTGNYIGVYGLGNNAFLNGYISEILVYNTPVSDSDRQRIEGYLASKWGLQASLPALHPYYSVAPAVATWNSIYTSPTGPTGYGTGMASLVGSTGSYVYKPAIMPAPGVAGTIYVDPVTNAVYQCTAVAATPTVTIVAGGVTQPVGYILTGPLNYSSVKGVNVNGAAIIADSKGNLYFSSVDTSVSGAILKVDPVGNLTTYAGRSTPVNPGSGLLTRGPYGATNGTLRNSTFMDLRWTVADASGNIYFYENGGYFIRKIDTAGNVTSFIGTGVNAPSGAGTDGGVGVATFNDTYYACYDKLRNYIWFATQTAYIRVININARTVTTVAGGGSALSGNGTSILFNSILGVAIDSTCSNLYIGHNSSESTGAIYSLSTTSPYTLSLVCTVGPSASWNIGAMGINSLNVLFFFNYISNRIYSFGGGIVQYYAGSGTAGNTAGSLTSANISNVKSIVFDAYDNMFFNCNNFVIMMISKYSWVQISGPVVPMITSGVTDPVVTGLTGATGTYYLNQQTGNLFQSGGTVPQSIPGLYLWMDGADPAGNGVVPANGPVATWVDKSGNGFNGTAGTSTPVYNSTNGFSFDGTASAGSGQTFVMPLGSFPYNNAGNGSYSFFVVAQYATSSTNGGMFTAGSGTNNSFSAVSASNTRVRTDWGSNSISTGVQLYTTNTSFVFSSHYQTAANRYQFFNGLADGTDSPAAHAQNNGQPYIGTAGFNGKISEIIIYNQCLSTTQRQIIESYLAKKWGVSLTASNNYNFNNLPKLVTGLQVWLDAADPAGTGVIPANGSTVATWADKSGNSYNATGGVSPTYNQAFGLLFNGTSQYLTLPNGAIPFGNTSFSIYFVITFTTGGTAGNLINAGNTLTIRSGGPNQISTSWPGSESVTSNFYTVNTPALFSTQYASGSTINQCLNGVLGASYTPAARNQPNTGNYIGAAEGSYYYLPAYISEILVYNVFHTTTQRELIEGYLFWKWGVQTLPITHPYFTATPYSMPSSVYNPYSSLPMSVPGLTLWLDGSDSTTTGTSTNGATVAKWLDKSGNQYNGFATTANGVAPGAGGPTLVTNSQNGLSGVAVIPANFIRSPIPSGTFINSLTIFIVYKVTNTGVGGGCIVTRGSTKTSTNLSNPLDMYTSAGTTKYNIGLNGAVSNIGTTYNGLNTTTSIFNLNINQDISQITTYSNGVAITVNAYTSWTASDIGNVLCLGDRWDGGQGTTPTNFYEVLVFNQNLTISDRQKIEGYLAWKWGLQSSLAATHPYKSAAPGTLAPAAWNDVVTLNGSLTLGSAVPTLPAVTSLNLDNYFLNTADSGIYKFGQMNPLTLPGLYLWLDGADPNANGVAPATGSTIANWYDKSGNGRTASGGVSPTYNTTYGLEFNGSSQYLTLPNGSIPFGDSNYSIYIVARFTNSSSGGAILFAGANNNGIVFMQSSGSLRSDWAGSEGSNNLAFTLNQSFVTSSVYQNGTSRTRSTNLNAISITISPNVARTQPNTGNFVGAFSTNGSTPASGTYMQGFISEIIVYNVAHSTSQRQSIEGYLAWKWGLNKLLATSHPYFHNPYNWGNTYMLAGYQAPGTSSPWTSPPPSTIGEAITRIALRVSNIPIRNLMFNPSPNGTNTTTSVYSTNGGTSWSPITGLATGNLASLLSTAASGNSGYGYWRSAFYTGLFWIGFTVAAQTKMYTSTDGYNWTLSTASPAVPFLSYLKYGSTYMFLEGNINAPIWTTTNGTTWTRNNPTYTHPYGSACQTFATDGSIILLGTANLYSNGGALLKSTNGGASFSYVTLPATGWGGQTYAGVMCIIYTGSRWFVGGIRESGVTYCALTSTDSTNWTIITQLTAALDWLFAFASNGSGRIVAVGCKSNGVGVIAYTTDPNGLNWTTSASGASLFSNSNSYPTSVGWTGTRFIAFSTNLTAYSTDGGITWTAATGSGGVLGESVRTWYGYQNATVGAI
jgi:hypothetical protein